MEKEKPVIPFLKWAGGKRWLVETAPEIFPKTFNRYFEPFLGAGSVFFHLQPKKAVLSDKNRVLIETYQAIQQDWQKVYDKLRAHHLQHSKEYYYRIRESKPTSMTGKAAKFIYLNRTCFNGIYRVNQKGVFNVPIGSRENVIFPWDDFEGISRVLQGAELRKGDFEETIQMAREGDLLFVDPPYTVRHNKNAFIKYNETLFSWEDQIRLSTCLKEASQRGVQIVGTNACHKHVKGLYRGTFKLQDLSRNSAVSAKISSRNKFNELLIQSRH